MTRAKTRKPVQKMGLKYRGIKPKTRQRYERQIERFFTFLRQNDTPLPTTFRKLDEMLAEYIDHMFLDDEPVAYAGDLISGFSRFYPASRLQIPITRLWFRNWQREVIRVRALPIPAWILQGLAGVALAMGRKDLAGLLPAAFLCMLRTGEILSLRPMDVTFSPLGDTAIIALHQTKTAGPNTEEAVLEDRYAVNALKAACRGLRPDETIYARAPRFLNEELRWLASLIGFEHKRFTPYSFRRGGATWHFHKYGSLHLTCIAGRWKHERTAKIYINGAAAEWMSWQVPSEGKQMLRRCSKAFKQRYA